MTIILALCIPLAFIAGGLVAYKGVQLGLRWQIETKQEQPPTMETPKNPIAPIFEARQEREVQSTFDEWMNGPQESR